MSAKGEFDVTESGWLFGGRSSLQADVVEMVWADLNSSYEATVPLHAEGFEAGSLELRYRIGKKRASEPSLVVIIRGVCAYRLDVNGSHREGPKLHQGVTHIQRRKAHDSDETYEPYPLGLPEIKLGHRVAPATYRLLLGAFAAPIGLDILNITWTDPPEGRQP
jgi:hypothetical protein